MPQVDFVTFNNQIFWALVVFFLLYNFITSEILEKIAVLHYVRTQLVKSLINWRTELRNIFFIFLTLVDTRYWNSLFFLFKQYKLLLYFIYIQYLNSLNQHEIQKFLLNLFVLQSQTVKQQIVFDI